MKLFSLFFLAIVVFGKKNFTKFPEKMFGKWMPTELPQSILGPLAYEFLTYHHGAFSALKHSTTGDVWFTVLWGQVFHVRENMMQYCFGELGNLAEQSPFEVDSVTDEMITFCWRSTMRRMPTHKDGCSGCDCARIQLLLTGNDTMQFTFWQSPPVTHVHLVLERTGRAPTFEAILSTMNKPYDQCDFRDKWGPNDPNVTSKSGPPGCAKRLLVKALEKKQLAQLITNPPPPPKAGEGQCHQLNGINHFYNQDVPAFHKYHIPDVRVQFIQPELPCNSSCNVRYSISADTEEDEYISLGFKGQSWEAKFPHPPEHPMRPCYFGMCVDDYDNFTNDRITVGYASSTHGSCVREMIATNLVGIPSDAEFKITTNQSVKRVGNRTILSFNTPQVWPEEKEADGWFRTMWAIGKVSGTESGCDAEINYHGKFRGVSPINWLGVLGSLPCDYDPEEMDP